MEGYRSRDRDGVIFVPAGEITAFERPLAVRVIEADQLIVVGDVDVGRPAAAPRISGEWGRIGPEPGPSRGGSSLSPSAISQPTDRPEIGKPLRHKGDV